MPWKIVLVWTLICIWPTNSLCLFLVSIYQFHTIKKKVLHKTKGLFHLRSKSKFCLFSHVKWWNEKSSPLTSKATKKSDAYSPIFLWIVCLDALKSPGVRDDKHFSPGAVELSSATSALSKMNGDGLCGAWEVLMRRPIESLLLLQLGCMIKCHLCDHPLSPTYHSLSISHRLSVCYSGSVPCCFCYLLLFFTSLSTFPSCFPCILPCVLISLSVSLCFSLHGSLKLSVVDFVTLSPCLPSIPSPPLVSPLSFNS